MNKPTFASVTDVPCTCGHLDRLAQDPNVPVEHVSSVGEYHLVRELPSGGRSFVVLYHCPFCGGALAASRRERLFAKISEEEATRLQGLVRGVTTVEDVSRVLGKPDDDRLVPTGPSSDSSAHAEVRRVLTFGGLSEVADVEVTVDASDHVEIVITPKYLGQVPQDNASQSSY